jgi:capsular polysaccharide biosynthesis protein
MVLIIAIVLIMVSALATGLVAMVLYKNDKQIQINNHRLEVLRCNYQQLQQKFENIFDPTRMDNEDTIPIIKLQHRD